MNRSQMLALAVASALAKAQPDRGNRYAPRTVKSRANGAVAQWREDCRTVGYTLCVQMKLLSEEDFYIACGYNGKQEGKLA